MTWTPPTVSAAVPTPAQPASRPASLRDDFARTTAIRQLIDDLLADPRQLGPDYQPVVRLADSTVTAVKATGRGRPGTDLADTLALLAGAQSLGVVERLDWAFRCLAFEDLLAGPALELHLTPEPETFGTICPPRLAAVWARARRELKVAAELHDDAFADPARLARGVAELREWGWRLIVADLGTDQAAWRQAGELRPDVVQVDFGNPVRRAPGGATDVAARAAEWGAELMAVNVDTPSARTAAVDAGIALARGIALGALGALPSR